MRWSALLAATLLFASAAHATDVSGTITTTTWTAESSPYHVTDTVRVAAGDTLTIEPGVDVLFDADVPFIVEGALFALGTQGDSIRFLASAENDSARWAGLHFVHGDSSAISYASVRDAANTTLDLGHDGEVFPILITSPGGAAVTVFGENTRCVITHGMFRGSADTTHVGRGVRIADDAWARMENCTVSGFTSGGGIAVDNGATLSMDSCLVTGNTHPSLWEGGGVYTVDATLMMSNCVVSDNTAGFGGGIYDHRNDVLSLTNCLFLRNRAVGNESGSGDGGGAYVVFSGPIFKNCTFAENTATGEGGGLALVTGYATVTNCIFWSNDAPSEPQIDAAPSNNYPLSYNSFQGDVVWPGNISVDPLFVDPENGDYHLQAESPCIDAGDPESPLDPDGTRADMGAFPFDGTGTSRLAFEPAASYPGGSFVLAVRATLADARGIDLAFVVDPTILTPSDPLQASSDVAPSPHANLIGDTVFVALANANSFSLAGDTLIVFARFDVAIDAPVDTSTAIRWVASPATVVDEHEAILVDGVVYIGEEPVVVLEARPEAFALEQNAPNPFNPSTTIGFAIPEAGHVRLDVYNVAGQLVTTLRETTMSAGQHAIVWNGTDRAGRVVASGVYVYRLVWTGELRGNSYTNANEVRVRRAVLLR